MDLLLLSLVAFSTSLLTAVIGLGGGVLLMLVMPGFMPLTVIVPVHAWVQFASNVTRVGFALDQVSWSLLPPLLLGSLVGAGLGAALVDVIPLDAWPLVAGLVILIVTWLPIERWLPIDRAALFFLGFYQTGLGMVAGATGPLGAAILAKIRIDRDWLVVNTGLYMTLNHGIRGMAFGLMGFTLGAWWLWVAVMSVATLLGSWLGTRLRSRVPQRNFVGLFRWVVTLLALRLMWMAGSERVLA